MAQKQYNSVIYFNLAGIGIVPGIVLTSRLEQIPGTQDTQEVLSVLYAHPEDEQHAIHKAKDIGDVKFTLKPASATNHFGWADTAEGAVPPEPEPVVTEPSLPELPPVEGVATLPTESVATEVPQDEKVAALLTELNDRQTELDQSEAENKQLREEVASLNSALDEKEPSAEPQPDVPAPTENPVTEPTPAEAVPESAA